MTRGQHAPNSISMRRLALRVRRKKRLGDRANGPEAGQR